MNYIYKIQDRLRLNHPTLWNLKIVHALAFGVLGNLIMLLLGYLATSIEDEVELYTQHYIYQSYSEDPGVLYFFSFILAVLSFIVWMVFYFRNNRLKRFYPITKQKLYIEWLLSFLIISSFCLFPLSVKLGSMAKKRSYMTEQKVNDGLNLLNRVSILNPREAGYLPDTSSYKIASPQEAYRYGSLLEYNEGYYDKDGEYLFVKDLLMKRDSLGIRKVMEEYITFQKEYIPLSKLTVEMWMNAIYHPPLYIVDRQSDASENLSDALSINSIRYMYRDVQEGYDYSDLPVMLLVALFFGLSISMTVFACRATSGKSWLIALVAHFVIMLLTALLQFVMLGDAIGYFLLWIFIYAACVIYVCWFVRNNGYKGKTPILMNLIITYSAVLLLFIFGTVFGIADEMRVYQYYDEMKGITYYTNDGFYNFLNEWKMLFFWSTLLLTIPLMYLITSLTLKWKALPEE